ncbi:acetate and sugar kinases/Hsc70/actin family protein [Spirosoma fluviale]|uniref:Uncharacterized protein n=1 Tax=Spirosoma fluviale TaxID=1597977 RepID=A0A286GLM3_9BACT|nr:hypothetical protein [Spirosoma fluviale]SOD96437.1 hypothetical protein SAMN06269250_5309 [Spirosoma fluviale]
MYYVALKIENRKYHTVQLRPADVAPAESFVPSFILEHQPGQARLVLSLLREARVVCRGGFDRDRWIDWGSLTAETTGDGLHLHLQATSTRPEQDALPPLPEPPPTVEFSLNKAHFMLGVTRHFSESALRLTLTITVDDVAHRGELLFHLVPQRYVHDVVMDFGSEASQIVTYRRGRGAVNRRMQLVGNLLDYYYPDLKGKELHQQDTESDLYRSAYFIKKEGAVFDPNASPGTNRDKELLNLLTDKGQKNLLAEERVLVSNLKLAHLGAYNFMVRFASRETNAFRVKERNFIDTIVQLQQAVVNYFLQVVLEEIKRSTPEGQPIYLVTKLLVPNVFEQSKVSRLVKGTANGLAEMTRQQATCQLQGFEVSTLSESDAAFLGFKREQEEKARQGRANGLKKGGRYLIIDVGKGTTDYSILKMNARSTQLVSLYRSGFIGAGNVLSYAFIDTIFAAICGLNSDDRKRAIQAVTQRADVVEKLQFTEAIEKLKHNYDAQRNYTSFTEVLTKLYGDGFDLSTIRSQLFDKNEAVLATLTQWLEKIWQHQGSIRDEWGIINRAVNEVANRIHREVVQSGRYADPETGRVLVDKIILTGRGFKFIPLRSAISKTFDVPVESTDDLKKVCLAGAFSSEPINFESNLVGFPEVYELFGQHERQSKQIDTGDGQVLNIPAYNRLKNWVQHTGAALQEQVRQVMEYGDGHVIQASTLPKTNLVDVSYDLSQEENFLNEGREFDNFNRNAKVVTICGLDYKRHTINSHTVNVFFTGEDFIIRDGHTYSPLQVEPDFFRNTQRVFQTLYPFVDILDPADVSVTPLTDDDF